MLPSLDATFIALIPKEEQSITLEKFRPIALCNVIYKIISKVITSLLKPLLPILISPEQSGYVEGRQIIDGIILTHEIIHSSKNLKKKMLPTFGFSLPWVRWVTSLITSTLFSILVNGIPSTPFHPSRGIHQGDPLSPFLFVLMAEGLGRIIKNSLQSQQLRGISFPNAPTFTNKQFVDDNMLFGHPSVQEDLKFKSPLNEFSEASGANINNVKSQIFFFHTPGITQSSTASILGFAIASLPSKYLGAPMTDSTLKHSSSQVLLEKIEACLSSWTFRALNMASHLVLVKFVLQSMPLYLFFVLATPKWVLKRIKNLRWNLLWGSTRKNRKWALVKWTTVCLPKNSRGTNLRDPQQSNAVMGTRLWWKWLSAPHTPWAILGTAKYANDRLTYELI
eukprot:PITA_10526